MTETKRLFSKRMTKKHLRCWAETLGIEIKRKTARRLRVEIQAHLLAANGQPLLAQTIPLRGVKAITQAAGIGYVEITVTHAWWALPLARRNMRHILAMRSAWSTACVRYTVASRWLWWRKEHAQ